MKIVAGLGNPGSAYAGTPHNAGFAVVDLLAHRLEGTWRSERRFGALAASARVGGHGLILAKPQTYMNASGQAVAALLRYYNSSLADLVVISDDADLPAGRLRVRPGGGAGGHRGLISIISHCGGEGFPRVRVGVGRGREGALSDHVLGRLPPEDAEAFERALPVAAEAALCLVSKGVDETMNLFNGWDAHDAHRTETMQPRFGNEKEI